MSSTGDTDMAAEILRSLNEKMLDQLLLAMRFCLVGALTDHDHPDAEPLRDLQASVERVLAMRKTDHREGR